MLIPELLNKAYKKEVSTPDKTVFMDDNEKEMIIQALEKSLWIQKDAARLLGISPRVLNYKIKKFDITHFRWRKNRKL